ncbi:U-box domain-containing protein 33-like [Zingiber officinale]|uniref:U-box domain-containing protein 33-like n=1 Tax=Zingiber officinale TaxID=94328 RepID=UPI001C4AE688|nr:U-box domain-containing protein 33-like [Zingiber officinale]XP_042391234.1 U-box domain-containing protein 33-like [Zingiber officinale]XP_042391235.1 U-box domain-containing protein 33-like [Zingiber officinale]
MLAGAASSQTGPREMEDEEKAYVAVVKQVKEGKANLAWVLQNTSKYCKIVLLHVHQPAQRIPTALGWFPASKLENQEVAAYRRMEEENMHGNLDEYVNMCSQVKVHKAEKVVIERDDIAEGLTESIVSHGITKLVMGAAASKNYSRKMKAPRSKTALAVKQKAHPSCKIWFICKGNLICTREALLDGSIVSQSFTASPISKTSQSEIHRPISASLSRGGPTNCSSIAPGKQDIVTQRSLSDDLSPYRDLTMRTSPTPSKKLVRSSTTESRESKEPSRSTSESKGSSVVDPLDAASSISDYSVFDEEKSDMASLSTMQDDADREGASLILQVKHEPEEYNKLLSPHQDQVNLGVDDVLCEKLQTALDEAESFTREAYEEFYKRQKAEKDLNEAIQKVKIVQNLYNQEFKQRIGIEEALAKEKSALLALKKHQDEVYEELKKAYQKMEALQLQNSDSDHILKDIKKKLSEAYSHLDSIRQEHDVLQQERDKAMRENQELKRMKEEATSSIHEADNFSIFSLSELEQATENFKEESKIGEGGYGCVYKGFLRHTTVAIKRLNPQGMQGKAEFQREMNVLSKVRHPNLVTLIGACPEAWALVYEFLPNGSLEDHLNCKKNAPPLMWQTRTCIAAEICSALIFLHSCKPFSVVHGDLKPGNILLDSNLVSKLGDFGICRLLVQSMNSTALYHCTRQPKGTFAYMDPELLTSGEITIKSDMYSFGVILLRLLTGRPAFGVSKVVQEALDKNCLHKILDGSAGDWPYLHAEKLAKVGLKCCQMKRRNRPDATEAWRILDPLTKSSFSGPLLSYRLTAKDSPYIPSYFICPILKEPMKDPQIAADGFTYEAEAIEGWFASGHGTSPMTNLKLDHHELIPNHTLRHAIQGWLQQMTQNSAWGKENASTNLSSTDV